jgi:hypothetical protein
MTQFGFSHAMTDIWCREKRGTARQSDINLCTSLNLFTSDELFMTWGAFGRLRYPFLWPCNIRAPYCAFVQWDRMLRKIISALVYCRTSTRHRISKNKFSNVWVLQIGLSLFRLIGSNPTPVFSKKLSARNKVVHMHVLKVHVCKGRGGTTPLFLNLCPWWIYVVSWMLPAGFTNRKGASIPKVSRA